MSLVSKFCCTSAESEREPVMVPAAEPVIVPTREPVIVPALDPVMVPTREPVMIPTLLVRDPVMVPANDAEERRMLSVAAAKMV
jgi:hypothetical protein